MKRLLKTYKDDYLFYLLFLIFVFLWLTTTVIFWVACTKNGIKLDATLIGSYANLLVFIATLFAPIAAYFFIDRWKEEKNKTFFSSEARAVWFTLQETEDFSYKIDLLLEKNKVISYNDFDIFQQFAEQLTFCLNRVHYFHELTDDSEIGKKNDYYISAQDTYHFMIEGNLFSLDEDQKQRRELIKVNEELRKLLIKHIIIK